MNNYFVNIELYLLNQNGDKVLVSEGDELCLFYLSDDNEILNEHVIIINCLFNSRQLHVFSQTEQKSKFIKLDRIERVEKDNIINIFNVS